MKNEFPLVSIIIPVLNRKELIKESIQSVQEQTYSNWELIIVDDRSTDGTWEYCNELSQTNLKVKAIKREKPQGGLGVCRNEGINKANGEYLIFLDSDDVLKSTCLEKRIEAFQKNEFCDFIVFQYAIFSQQIGDRKKRSIINLADDDIENFLDEKSPWLTPCCIWKKEKIKQINGFDESILNWIGWDIHMKALIQNLKYKKYDEIDCYVREHDGERITKSDPTNVEVYQEKLFWREEMFKKIYYLFIQYNQSTKKRNKKWARLFFVTSLEWIRLKNKKIAIDCWKFVKQTHMISFFSYYFILFILKIRFRLIAIQKIVVFKWITSFVYKLTKRIIFK